MENLYLAYPIYNYLVYYSRNKILHITTLKVMLSIVILKTKKLSLNENICQYIGRSSVILAIPLRFPKSLFTVTVCFLFFPIISFENES